MRLYKILALMYGDLLLVKNSKYRIMEYLYFPISTVLIYGMFSIFVEEYAVEAGLLVFIANVLWSFALVVQSHVNMSMNEDSWSGSLKQIMASDVSAFEYITARVATSVIISVIVMLLLVAVSAWVFGIDIFITEWELFGHLTLSTLIVSVALSVFIAGAMIALGREYAFLAWTALQAFILLSAPFYPVSLFPEFMRPLINIMPYTNVFESARGIIAGADVSASMNTALIIAVAYLAASLIFYRYIFKKSLQKGWLVRLG